MGRRTSVLTLVIINVIVTLVVVVVVISLVNSQNANQPANQIVITVPVLITSTINPNTTQEIKIITATPMPGTPGVVQLPTGLIDNTGSGGTLPPIATIDPNILSGDSALQLTATSLPPNCILHTVAKMAKHRSASRSSTARTALNCWRSTGWMRTAHATGCICSPAMC